MNIEYITLIIISGALIYASIMDIKYRKVTNAVSALILVAAIINLIHYAVTGQAELITLRIISFLLVLISFVLVAALKGGIGGADTKIAATLALYMPYEQTIRVILASYILALIGYGVRRISKNKEQSFPYIPYLATAFIITIIIKAVIK